MLLDHLFKLHTTCFMYNIFNNEYCDVVLSLFRCTVRFINNKASIL